MPPPLKRDDCVILFDLNVANDFFLKARECLLDIYANKWWKESNDYVCLLPYGKEKITDNGFDNYDPLDVKNTITGVETNDGKILNALLSAAKILERRHYNEVARKGLYTRQLLCISDFSKSTFSDSNTVFEELVEKLNSIGAFLYILGPEVALDTEKIMMNGKDMRQWIKMPVFVMEETENLKMLKRLVQAVKHAVVCGFTMGLIMFGYYKHWAGPKPCLLPLTMADRIQFTNRSLRCLKKLSYSIESVGWNWTCVLASNPEVEVDYKNVARALYDADSEKLVVITQEIKDSFKTKGERSFDLLGFAYKENVQPLYFTGDGSHKMIPAGLYAHWTLALIRVLKEKNLVAIASKRVIRNTKRKFWALIPAENERWFYVVQLAFGNCMDRAYNVKEPDPEEDDLNRLLDPFGFNSEEPDETPPTPPHQEAIYEYLDSMQLSGADMPVNVTMCRNPQFKRFCRLAVQKHTGIEMDLQEEAVLGKRDVSDEPLKRFWKERAVRERVEKKTAVEADDGGNNKNDEN